MQNTPLTSIQTRFVSKNRATLLHTAEYKFASFSNNCLSLDTLRKLQQQTTNKATDRGGETIRPSNRGQMCKLNIDCCGLWQLNSYPREEENGIPIWSNFARHLNERLGRQWRTLNDHGTRARSSLLSATPPSCCMLQNTDTQQPHTHKMQMFEWQIR
jgi:hypothetical protein